MSWIAVDKTNGQYLKRVEAAGVCGTTTSRKHAKEYNSRVEATDDLMRWSRQWYKRFLVQREKHKPKRTDPI